MTGTAYVIKDSVFYVAAKELKFLLTGDLSKARIYSYRYEMSYIPVDKNMCKVIKVKLTLV